MSNCAIDTGEHDGDVCFFRNKILDVMNAHDNIPKGDCSIYSPPPPCVVPPGVWKLSWILCVRILTELSGRI